MWAVIDSYRRRLALLVASCYFMENLDGTIVTTAAPKLRAALGVSSTAIGLLIASYLVTFAVVIPVGNWLMTRIGERRLFLSAIAIFTIASLACALSHNLSEMVPVGRIVVLANSEKSDIVRLVAYIVWPGLLAPALAPLVGGVIVTFASWQWLFAPNVPLGVGAFVAGWLIMKPSTRRRATNTRLDWRGMLLTVAGLGGLVYGAFVAGQLSSSWARVGVDLAAATAVMGLAVAYLRGRRDAFLDLSVLRVRTFAQSLRGIAAFTVVVGSVPLMLPLLFQDRFGWSPVKSGALVLFVFLGNIAAKPSTTYLLNRFGYRRVLVTTSTAVAATMAGFAFLSASTPVEVIALLAFANGVVRSIGYSGLMTLVYSDVDEANMAHGTTLAATLQQVVGGFAASVGVVALRIGSSLTRGGALNSQGTFRIAFFLMTLLALLPVANALTLHPSAGDSLRQRSASRS